MKPLPVALGVVIKRLRLFCLVGIVLSAIACESDTAPDLNGQLALWTNCVTCGVLSPTVNGDAEGKLTAIPSFPAPTCDDTGTITLSEKAGTYSVTATDTSGDKFAVAQVTVNTGHCTTFEFAAPPGSAGSKR